MNFLRQLFNKTNKFSIPLGRWNHKIDNKSKLIRATWANSDHCGDYICGKPDITKKIISDIKENK